MSGALGDWWWLQIAIAFIYLLECVVWVPANTLMVERRRRGYRFRLASQAIQLRERSLVLINPLTPWRSVYLLPVEPITICDRGVLLAPMQQLDSAAPDGQLVDWDQIRGVWHEGRCVHLGREIAVVAGDGRAAEALAKSVRSFWECGPVERTQRISDREQDRTDPARIRRVVLPADSELVFLQCGVTTLLVMLLLCLPLNLAVEGSARTAVLLGCLLAWLLVITTFWRSRDPGPAMEWKTLFKMILLPPAAIAAVSLRSRALLLDAEPAALVLALSDGAAPDAVERFILRDLVWRMRAMDQRASELLLLVRQRLVARLRSQHPHLDRFITPPDSRDPQSIAYCPRCHAQYVRSLSECVSCHGVELVAFDASTSQA